MKLPFALLTCSAAFHHFREADTGGGFGGADAPSTSQSYPEPPTADPAVQAPGTEGPDGEPFPPAEQDSAQNDQETPLQDGATAHIPDPLTDEEKARVAEDANRLQEPPNPPVMPDDVKTAITELVVKILDEREQAKAQAPQPHGGIGSEAAKVEAKFQSVPLSGDKREKVQQINDIAKALALAVEEFVPAGKEKDFAHAAIMGAAMFANSAISRHPSA